MKILVVEDDKKILKIISQSLVQEGYEVYTAATEEQAFNKLTEEDFNLIILDIGLDNTDSGFKVCHFIRQELKGSVPILILTARSDIEDKVRGFDIGADDYMTKPFELEELKARAKALIRRDSTIRANVIKLDELEVNSNSHEVKVKGKQITLTPREFLLLEHFFNNVGKTLKKSELLSTITTDEKDTLSNNLEVHIKNLRKKLGKSGRLIHTVRGVGYLLNLND